ncbi:MAG: glycoside hydrolase family 125 protein [Peptoniphilaceae bacterium]|nr:glycoside hydrolase family 125 protein [Peptoniphilaceae bacterium]MDY6019255.1 glycoside hydrolase family 125 protein [Anaerococcus sp.]
MKFEFLEDLVKKVYASDLTDKQKKIFEKILYNTFTKTIKEDENGLYIITGDIEAMWLRDSSLQVLPLIYVDHKEANYILKKTLERQFFYLRIDSYANSFNQEANGRHWSDSDNCLSDWVWERKYEIDSIAFVFFLLNKYIEKTSDRSILNNNLDLIDKLLNQIILEQDHSKSSYYFIRKNNWPNDQLENKGFGRETKEIGLTWSAFRPSDDACYYNYNIPGNILLFLELEELGKYLEDERIKNKSLNLSKTIRKAVYEKAVFEDEEFGKIFAYEIDGLGNKLLIDDANLPNLLSLKYFGLDDQIAKNTRAFVLSEKNPYFYQGTYAKGLGSSHTKEGHVWHIALLTEVLITDDIDKKKELLNIIEKTDGGSYLMHEGFDVNNPNDFTREFFSWANSMYVLAILQIVAN